MSMLLLFRPREFIPTYTQAVSGVIVAGRFSGTMLKSTAKVFAGVNGSFLGTQLKHTSKSLTGTSGSITGSLSALRMRFVSLTGSLGTISGGVLKSTNKIFAGNITGSGGVLKRTSKVLSGTAGALTGSLTKSKIFFVALSGAITMSGSLTTLAMKSRAKMKAGYAVISRTASGYTVNPLMRAGHAIISKMRGGKVD